MKEFTIFLLCLLLAKNLGVIQWGNSAENTEPPEAIEEVSTGG